MFEAISVILNKSENATPLLVVKMVEKRFYFNFFSCNIKCLMSCYTCAVRVFLASESQKNETFLRDFISFLKDKSCF